MAASALTHQGALAWPDSYPGLLNTTAACVPARVPASTLALCTIHTATRLATLDKTNLMWVALG